MVASWPVTNLAVGVTDASNTLALAGPVEAPFALASVTKLLVALACWVAVEEETLRFDQPVALPGPVGIASPAGDAGGVTVAHLLAHASGLGPDERRAVARPGTRRIYSNAGFELLAETVETASGLTMATYLHEAVLDPLGCAHSSLNGSAAHGAQASVVDLLAIGRELLHPHLIDPATLQLGTQPWIAELAGVLPGFGRHDPNPWGLGVEVRGVKAPHWTGRRNAATTFGHFGRSGTFLWVDPEAGLALSMLGDLPFGVWATSAWPTLSDRVLTAAGR